MDTFEVNEIMVIAALFCIGIVLSKLAVLAERMKKIEILLHSVPGAGQAPFDLSPEVKAMIIDGHKYKAMILHRKQTDSCARNAEIAVEEYITRRGMVPKTI